MPNSKSILCVTGHWLTNDLGLKDVLFDAIEIKGNLNGENYGNCFIKIVEIYVIKDKIICITTDNTTNNTIMTLYLEQFCLN